MAKPPRRGQCLPGQNQLSAESPSATGRVYNRSLRKRGTAGTCSRVRKSGPRPWPAKRRRVGKAAPRAGLPFMPDGQGLPSGGWRAAPRRPLRLLPRRAPHMALPRPASPLPHAAHSPAPAGRARPAHAAHPRRCIPGTLSARPSRPPAAPRAYPGHWEPRAPLPHAGCPRAAVTKNRPIWAGFNRIHALRPAPGRPPAGGL